MVLSLSSKGKHISYYSLTRYVLLFIGIVAAYDKVRLFNSNNSMQNIIPLRISVKNHVVSFNLSVERAEKHRISVCQKKRVHTRANGIRSVRAMLFELVLYALRGFVNICHY